MIGPNFAGRIMLHSADGPHITASKLKVGGKYLHRNLGWYRTIVSNFAGIINYKDFAGYGRCSTAHFADTCPTEATEEEIEYLNKQKYPSFS